MLPLVIMHSMNLLVHESAFSNVDIQIKKKHKKIKTKTEKVHVAVKIGPGL